MIYLNVVELCVHLAQHHLYFMLQSSLHLGTIASHIVRGFGVKKI